MATGTLRGDPLRAWDLGLWAAQAVLGALFGLTGALRVFVAPAQLASGRLDWADPSNAWWLTVSGLTLMIAALALVVPPLLGIAERLVPATAMLMAMAMVISMASHVLRGAAGWLLTDVLVGALCVFVAWGRVYKVRYEIPGPGKVRAWRPATIASSTSSSAPTASRRGTTRSSRTSRR